MFIDLFIFRDKNNFIEETMAARVGSGFVPEADDEYYNLEILNDFEAKEPYGKIDLFSGDIVYVIVMCGRQELVDVVAVNDEEEIDFVLEEYRGYYMTHEILKI